MEKYQVAGRQAAFEDGILSGLSQLEQVCDCPFDIQHAYRFAWLNGFGVGRCRQPGAAIVRRAKEDAAKLLAKAVAAHAQTRDCPK